MAARADEARLTPARGVTGSQLAAKLRTPFATLAIVTEGDAIASIRYLPRGERAQAARTPAARLAVEQLQRYLDDPGWRFTLPLAARGTAFQRRVWEAICAIPVGESRTYGEIARSVRSSARAVGGACGANRIALVIPCHRVVGSRGVLGGFMNEAEGESVEIKRWLLAHEGYRFGA